MASNMSTKSLKILITHAKQVSQQFFIVLGILDNIKSLLPSNYKIMIFKMMYNMAISKKCLLFIQY